MRSMAVSATKPPLPVEFYTKPAPSVPVRTLHPGHHQVSTVIPPSQAAEAASPRDFQAHACSPRRSPMTPRQNLGRERRSESEASLNRRPQQLEGPKKQAEKAEIRPKAEARPRQEVKPRKVQERSPPWPAPRAATAATATRAKANSFQEVLSPRRPPETPRRGGAVRPESPHDCINRSRSPDIDGVITMRRSGAGKSSGGGPSSICLGEERPLQRAVSAEPRLKQSFFDTFHTIQDRRRSDGLVAEARESEFRDRFERVPCESPRVPCESPRLRERREGWPDYDELAAENWQLRQEVRQLRSELEKYKDWYAKLTSSYYNGNGYLK